MSSLVHQKIIQVMKLTGAIGKEKQGMGFKFRGIDDVYNALHDVLADVGLFSVPEILEERSEERATKSGGVLIYRILKIKYTFYAEDGSNLSLTVMGEAMDSGDKASNKAMSVAHKYALLQIFCIPTIEDKDPESGPQPDLKPRGNESKPIPPKAPAPPPIPPKIFSSENIAQVQWLQKVLDAEKISKDMHPKIMDFLDGKDLNTEVKSIINRVKAGDTLDGILQSS